MTKQELFDTCIQEAIFLGRRYMAKCTHGQIPTSEEWQLALVLFQNEIQNERP